MRGKGQEQTRELEGEGLRKLQKEGEGKWGIKRDKVEGHKRGKCEKGTGKRVLVAENGKRGKRGKEGQKWKGRRWQEPEEGGDRNGRNHGEKKDKQEGGNGEM